MKKCAVFLSVLLFAVLLPAVSFASDNVYAAPVEGYMALRISPDENSHEITKIPACAKLTVLERRRTWGRVVFRKKCGWINLSFTASSYKDAAQATGYDAVKNVKVASENKNTSLYSLPSTLGLLGSVEKYTVPNDTILSVSRETKNGWGLVSMNGKYAWVQLKHTKPYESFAEEENHSYGIYYVYVLSERGEGLNLMSERGGGTILAKIPDCIKLTVRTENGNYGYVSYDGYNGWIDLKYTTNTLANAQTSAGVLVNKEYTVLGAEGNVQLMSVPSDYAGDMSFSQGSVKPGETVFVTRSTASGWSFVTVNGVRGWIKPGQLSECEEEDYDAVQLCEPYYVYGAARTKKGIKVYPDKSALQQSIATLPECIKLQVISENGDYLYVYSDYAAGWIDRADTRTSYDEALMANKSDKAIYCRISIETNLLSVPMYSIYSGRSELMLLNEGTELAVIKTVTTGKRKWGLVKASGQYGWVNLNCTKKTVSPIVRAFIFIAAALILTAILFVIYYIFRRKKNERVL